MVTPAPPAADDCALSSSLRGHWARRAAAAALVAALAGCATTAPLTGGTLGSSSPPARGSPLLPTVAGTLAPGPATLGGCPAPQRESQLPVVARLGADPDDVIVDGAGNIWVTALAAHRITELSPTGQLLSTVTDSGGPEGIAALPGNRFVVADQQANALSVFTAGDGRVSPLESLSNHTANAGVDGIYYDSASNRLLVPDSPNGTLLSYVPGGTASVLRSGLGRPVAASTDSSGAIYVGMENAPGVIMISASGTVRSLGSLRQVDEVVSLDGLLYVADLAGTVDAIDPVTGRSTILVTAAPSPQGLAATATGQLVLVDETTRVVAMVAPCR